MQIKELYNKIVDKSQKDANFKKELLKNAKETIRREFNVDFGSDVEVSVYQSTPEHRHFVIPLDN